MIRILCAVGIAAIIALGVYGLITTYDNTLQVGRMWETPAIRPHETPLPVMPSGIVAFEQPENLLRTTKPEDLKPSVPLENATTIAAGKTAYGYFCIQCHGKHYDGMGTVGQSFAPLPTDLRSPAVQQKPIGQLFKSVSYGIPGGRQPPLETTMTVDDRWRVLAYIKSLGIRP